MCVYMDGKVSMVFNRICFLNERLFKGRRPTGSHVHRKSGRVKEMARDIHIVTTHH